MPFSSMRTSVARLSALGGNTGNSLAHEPFESRLSIPGGRRRLPGVSPRCYKIAVLAPSKLRALPGSFWLLWGGSLIDRLGSFVGPFLAIYLTEKRGLSVAQAGIVVSLYGAGSLAAGPTGGALADRFGRRAALVFALSSSALAMLNLALAHSILHVAAATLVLGFVGALYRPAVAAAVADLVAPEQRPRAYGLLYWANNLGFAVAIAAGGALAGQRFSLLFALDGGTSLVFALLVGLWFHESRPPLTAPSSSSARAGGAYRDPLALAFAGSCFLAALVLGQSLSTLPLQMRSHGIALPAFGGLLAINGALIVTIQPFSAQLLRGIARERILAGAALLMGIGFALGGLAHTPALYALSIAVWTLGEIALIPNAMSVMADLAPSAQRGGYQGMFSFAWSLSWCLAPALGSLVLERAGEGALAIGCALSGCAGAGGFLAVAAWGGRRWPSGLAKPAQGGEPREPGSDPVA
jgi:MFS family permease